LQQQQQQQHLHGQQQQTWHSKVFGEYFLSGDNLNERFWDTLLTSLGSSEYIYLLFRLIKLILLRKF
jgi:hypothetical protein